jgi:hypothetical protein
MSRTEETKKISICITEETEYQSEEKGTQLLYYYHSGDTTGSIKIL